MSTNYRRSFFVSALIIAISLLFAQTTFAMQLPGLSVTMTCNDFSYGDFNIVADRDNTNNNKEAFRITITDGQGTVLHQIENLDGIALGGPYFEGGVTGASFNQSATALDNVRTYTWLSLAGNGELQDTVYTTTNPDCTSGGGSKPTSNFTFSVTDLSVDFTDTSTESPTSWAWDFDDGNSSTQQNPSHTFAAADTYNVCLTASNSNGTGTQSCKNVNVTDPAPTPTPVSNFTFSVTDLSVDFTDTSTENPTSWAWDFDDGNNSTQQNPSHTFAAADTYNVCLTATNVNGTGTQSCQNVTVSAGHSSNNKPPAPSPDRDDDGVPNSRDNCPDAYNPDQEDGWGTAMGDACDTDWYNMSGIGINGFEQKDGMYHLHGNCTFMDDGDPRCPEVAIFDPSALSPDDMPAEITSDMAGTWSVWIYYLHSNNGVDVYQVNVYSTNPPQPDTLIDDRLELHISGGSWQWYQRGGSSNYNGI